MTTRLYFAGSETVTPTPSTDASWSSTTGFLRRALIRAKYASPSSIAIGSTISWANTAGTKALDRQYISPPLASQTISGTVSIMAMVRMFAASDNVDRAVCSVRVIDSSGTVVATLLAHGLQTGATTAAFLNSSTCRCTVFANAASLTSYSCSAGDRIVVEMGFSNSTAGTTPQGATKWGENATDATLGNTTTTTNVAPWIEFSGNLTWAAPTISSLSVSSGGQSGGQSVTITGTGFYNGSTTVAFGSNNATSVVVTSSTTLTCIVPASTTGAGAVNVTVTNGDGTTSNTLTGGFTYNAARLTEAVFLAAGGAQITVNESNYSGGTWVDEMGVAGSFTQPTSGFQPAANTSLSPAGQTLLYFDGTDDLLGQNSPDGVIPTGSFTAWSGTGTKSVVEHVIMIRPNPPDDVNEQRVIDYGGNEYYILNLFTGIYRAGATSDVNIPGGRVKFITVEHNVVNGTSTMTVDGVAQSDTGTNDASTRTDLISHKWFGAKGDGVSNNYNGWLALYGIGWAPTWGSTERTSLLRAMQVWFYGSATQGSYTFTGQVVGLKVQRKLSAAAGTFTESGQDATLTYTPGSGNSYSLTVDQGSFTESGQAVGLTAQRTLTAAQGSFAETGQNVGLTAQRKLTVAQGSLAETGQAITLTAARLILPSGGSFTFTGEAVALFATLPAAQGSFTLSGQSATFSLTRRIAASQGSFTESGQATSLTAQRKLAADQGSFTETGQAAGLYFGRKLSASSGSFTETGQDATFSLTRRIAASQGSFTETGQAVALLRGRFVTAASGSFAETGQATTIAAQRKLSAGVGTFTETGNDAILTYEPAGSFTASPGTFELDGQDATLSAQRKIVAAQGSFTETGQAAALKAQRKLTAAQGSLTESGQAAALQRGYRLSAATGSFVESGQSITLKAQRKIGAAVGSFTESGQAVSFAHTVGIFPAAGSFALSGKTVGLRYGRKFPVNTGSIAETGQAAGLHFGRKLSASSGSFTETGQAATFALTRRIAAGVGSIVETGKSVGLRAQRLVALALGSFTLDGQDAELSRTRAIVARAGTVAVDGQAVRLLRGIRFISSAGSFAFDGQPVSLSYHRGILVSAAVFALAGQDVGLRADRFVSIDAGSFHLALQPQKNSILVDYAVRPKTLLMLDVQPRTDIELSIRPLSTTLTLTVEPRISIELTHAPRTRIIMSHLDTYDVGDDAEVRIVVRRRRTGALIDPLTLVVRVQSPDGTLDTMTFDDGVTEARLLRDPGSSYGGLGLTPEGVFIPTIPFEQVGTYIVDVTTTGEGKGMEPTEFRVRTPRIPIG